MKSGIGRRMAGVTLALAAACAIPGWAKGQEAREVQETKEQRDQRMAWWREARFGMFIHWGIYSVPAGVYKGEQIKGIGEWIMLNAKIPVAEYAKYAEQFNPVKFDAEKWVRAAKDAGMKYIVITSKHHDGFAMFHSKDPYNIYDATPFKRDPLAELAAACRKEGIKLGFYYSQAQDWHHPGGAAARAGHWDPAQDGSFDDYLKNVAAVQVREILSNYGPVAVLWWDTPVNMTPERAEPLYKLAKQLQPRIVMNNRLGGGFQGDTETPEQYIPATGFPGRDWETCMTMNDTWGYKSWDHNWKSPETLLRNLIDIASKGGNYLLNVGPTSEGEIPEASLERLAAIGKWMRANGDAVYGTTASPFRKYGFDGRCTVRGNTLYVHVFNWPDGGVKLVGLQTPVEGASVLATGEAVQFMVGNDKGTPVVTIAKPADTDSVATVVALKLSGAPQVDNSAMAVHAGAGGTLTLKPADATITGKAKVEDGQIAWAGKRDAMAWDVLVPGDGDYVVKLTYACDEKEAGSTYVVSAEQASLKGKVEATGSGEKTADAGKVHLTKGVQTVMLRATDVPHGAVMKLRQVELVPVKAD